MVEIKAKKIQIFLMNFLESRHYFSVMTRDDSTRVKFKKNIIFIEITLEIFKNFLNNDFERK